MSAITVQSESTTRIEPWWNLNDYFPELLNIPVKTRIEPWWNLNSALAQFGFASIQTRIEPWWNLNPSSPANNTPAITLELNHGGI